jgi:hypothetical protein
MYLKTNQTFEVMIENGHNEKATFQNPLLASACHWAIHRKDTKFFWSVLTSEQFFLTLIQFQISLWVSGTEHQTE